MLYDQMITWHMKLWLLFKLWLCIQLTWYRHVNYLTLMCLYLTCYHLTPDIWYLTPDDWHAITWYWYTWPDVVTLDWILLHLTPVLHCILMIITLRGLDVIIILLPDIGTPELLYPWTYILLNSYIPYTHVLYTVTLINSTIIPISGRACLVSGWRGCIPRSC